MYESVLVQQADRVKPLIRDFAISHTEGILYNCTEGSDEEGRRRVATQIVDEIIGGHGLYAMAQVVVTSKVRNILGIPLDKHLSWDELLMLSHSLDAFTRAGDEVYWDRDFTERVCGRYVWDYGYQPAQRRPGMIPWHITMH